MKTTYTNSRRKLKSYVRARDKGVCVYCDEAVGQDIDHVIPVSWGGPTIRGNLVLACKKCNNRKSNNMDDTYLIKAFKHLISLNEDISWLNKQLQLLDLKETNTA